MLPFKTSSSLTVLLGSCLVLSSTVVLSATSVAQLQRKTTTSSTPTYSAPAPAPRPAPTYSAPAPTRSAPAPERSSPAPSYSSGSSSAPRTYSGGSSSSGSTSSSAPRSYSPSSSAPSSSGSTYTPRTYSPGGSSSGSSTSTSRPATSSSGSTYTPHTYTPGSGASSSTSSTASRPASSTTTSSGGATTYTPHTYTPGSGASSSTPSTASRPASSPTTSGGATTYTPHTYTPGASASPATSSAPTTARPVGSGTGGALTPRPVYGGSLSSGTPSNVGSGRLPNGANSPTSGGAVAHPIYKVPETAIAARAPGGGSTLTPSGSHDVVHQLNTDRGSFSGINHQPLPPGKVTVAPNGHVGILASNGRNFDVRANGHLAEFRRPGEVATFRNDGHLSHLHSGALDIVRGPHGQRVIVAERPDHTRIVAFGRRAGYVERPINIHGGPYIERRFAGGGFGHASLYAHYSYHGLALDHYVPHYTYAPAFYGWAYYGWARPVNYAWGWDSQPWLGYYGGYYSPAMAYTSGALWLADYYLGNTLAAAYQQQDPGGDPGDEIADAQDPGQYSGDEAYATADTPITPAIRQAISEEVQQQLAYENAAAAQPTQAATLTDLPQVMQPGHVFVVSQPLNVTTVDQRSCVLSAGNVLQLAGPPPADSPTAVLSVMGSRRADCPANVHVQVSLNDLQEMQNNFRAQLDDGLHTLHDRQGQGGLPGAPNSAIAPPPIPGPDIPEGGPDVQAALQAQREQAATAESGITKTAFAQQP